MSGRFLCFSNQILIQLPVTVQVLFGAYSSNLDYINAI
ncbi:hypothetical protein ADIARSV_0438 [Arcticibacter svalbardensis MN12-7]|uniref:Uncharacterized protein n=1 Tax=Arcticibacter svalbardensis MN12-7 TaxID=1150600 RepID=R9GXA7_9SPHI|nr:hypothetical protein ADIARSV_0438 [Arcticibacter svalbardensis MN12-7]